MSFSDESRSVKVDELTTSILCANKKPEDYEIGNVILFDVANRGSLLEAYCARELVSVPNTQGADQQTVSVLLRNAADPEPLIQITVTAGAYQEQGWNAARIEEALNETGTLKPAKIPVLPSAVVEALDPFLIVQYPELPPTLQAAYDAREAAIAQAPFKRRVTLLTMPEPKKSKPAISIVDLARSRTVVTEAQSSLTSARSGSRAHSARLIPGPASRLRTPAMQPTKPKRTVHRPEDDAVSQEMLASAIPLFSPDLFC
jgi:hypothetical protein